MQKLTDEQLIQELRRRFIENKKSLHELKKLMKQLEIVNKKLEESEALKSNFLSNIRNEINNPLTSILGLSENLMTGNSLNCEEIFTIAKMIHLEAFSLDYQLRNIFAAAELEAGEATPYFANVDINSLILERVNSFRQKAEGKKLDIKFINEIPGEKSFFKTDSEKLQLILSNLICNALEYSQEGGQIEVKAWLEADKLHITVTDSGVGMDKYDVKRIFDRFVQLETGLTKSHKGHGLGLSIIKDLLNLLNGSISVTTKKNKGSTFTIVIPEADIEIEDDLFAFDGNELIFEDFKEF